jgi:hypothetical protein
MTARLPQCLGFAILAACGARTELPIGTFDEAPALDAAVAPEASRPEVADGGRDATSPPGPDASAEVDASMPPCAGGCGLTFASGSDWASYAGTSASDGGLGSTLGPGLGAARAVCVTPNNPPNCPGGALIYGSPSTPWAGGRAIPSAFWIWRGDVTTTQFADFQVAAFQKTFVVGVQPTGSIQVAVDDRAEVFVNGRVAGAVGSISDYAAAGQAENVLVTLDLTPVLSPGAVTLTVVAQNGPPSFGTGCNGTGCTYSQNPAGVVFAGTLGWR